MGRTRLAYRLVTKELERSDLSQHDRMQLLKWLVTLERRRPKTLPPTPGRKRGRPRKVVIVEPESPPDAAEKENLKKFISNL